MGRLAGYGGAVKYGAGPTSEAAVREWTLDYVFERYSIEVPPKLPYGPEPPIYDLAPNRLPRRVMDDLSVTMTMKITGDEALLQESSSSEPNY